MPRIFRTALMLRPFLIGFLVGFTAVMVAALLPVVRAIFAG